MVALSFMLVSNAMKKFILNIILFFAIIVAIDLLVSAAGGYMQGHAKGGDTKRFDDLVEKDEHDILILGSSRAHHHYDTPFLSDTLGMDVYNAGIDGNGVVLAYGILEMVLNRYKPKLVLYDVEPAFDINEYSADNNHTRYISKLKPYYNEHGIEQIIKDVSIEEWRKVQSGLLRFNTGIITILMDNLIAKENSSQGYAPMNGIMQREINESDQKQSKQDIFKINYIEKLILLCKYYDVPLVMIASPKYGAESVTVFDPIVNLCSQYDIPFWNYYNDVDFMSHKSWFNEPMHLNANGARAFSISIVEKMEGMLQ